MARRTRPEGGTPATAALTTAGIAFTARSYAHDPAAASYGLEAAAALGVPAAQVFKTLLVQAETGLVGGIVPVDRQLDLKAVVAAIGVKRVQMAEPSVAERVTGYVLGGISPIGQKHRLPTLFDDSAAGYDAVLVSGGRRGFDIELKPHDLLAATGGLLAPIAR